MSDLGAAQLKEAAMEGYFATVDRKALDAVLGMFVPDATLCMQTANQTYEGRDSGIRGMFEGFFEAYASVSHDDIEIVVDPSRQRVAAQFVAVRTTPDGGEERASNCNFFHFADGKIAHMWIYMSDDISL
jgi:ketosteroid isomerase-like protein